ncbi:unnamed protein product (mitochondrion) [Plasmodiophora brassicae]|uniref:Alginate lyase domain-containing protein n=1 Tax=Plasmodiophora brassicae TaxID=37360 RepID=A0A0G4J190_PLABS|nr:hypothetical protein PBRA_001936 [Plasmodiophora brassicae]SPR01358.1 unnamed protein product [Plasmodiophora brassicae]
MSFALSVTPFLLLFGTVFGGCYINQPSEFIHPGLLHTDEDFQFVRFWVEHGYEPYLSGWSTLQNNWHSRLSYTARASPIVYRGDDGVHPQNYHDLMSDAHAAYLHALLWKISGDDRWADIAVQILNACAVSLEALYGTADRFLMAGFQGYQIANAGEILRRYPRWSKESFQNFTTMMLNVFYPMNKDFLVRHNDAHSPVHYWSNWDLGIMASLIAIGVVADRPDIYNFAVDYFYRGSGNGAINRTSWVTCQDGTAQDQESGRDQGHATLSIMLLTTFCQMAWAQKCDLFGYDDNRVLKGQSTRPSTTWVSM